LRPRKIVPDVRLCCVAQSTHFKRLRVVIVQPSSELQCGHAGAPLLDDQRRPQNDSQARSSRLSTRFGKTA
jgi:hypothetical protein